MMGVHATRDTAEAQDFGVAVDRSAHLDDMTVNFVCIRETHSLKDALAGLPNGQCRCPHWGYVLSRRSSPSTTATARSPTGRVTPST